jgi:nuclease S1
MAAHWLASARVWAAAACVALPTLALAWAPEGHEVVALIAQQRLTSEVSKAADALLALEPEPGATLASVASWADRIRDKNTAAWHYVNLPRDADCQYLAARDCPGGDCAVGALEAQVKRLASNAPPAERLEALKWVVHLVGDLHQPLHAGFADDRGGNTWQLQAFDKGTNLHALWDSGLLREIEPNAAVLAARLDAADLATRSSAPSLVFAPATWAQQSCRIVSRIDFYPPRELPAAYGQTFNPVVQARLRDAGLRLAATLNAALTARPASRP